MEGNHEALDPKARRSFGLEHPTTKLGTLQYDRKPSQTVNSEQLHPETLHYKADVKPLLLLMMMVRMVTMMLMIIRCTETVVLADPGVAFVWSCNVTSGSTSFLLLRSRVRRVEAFVLVSLLLVCRTVEFSLSTQRFGLTGQGFPSAAEAEPACRTR